MAHLRRPDVILSVQERDFGANLRKDYALPERMWQARDRWMTVRGTFSLFAFSFDCDRLCRIYESFQSGLRSVVEEIGLSRNSDHPLSNQLVTKAPFFPPRPVWNETTACSRLATVSNPSHDEKVHLALCENWETWARYNAGALDLGKRASLFERHVGDTRTPAKFRPVAKMILDGLNVGKRP